MTPNRRTNAFRLSCVWRLALVCVFSLMMTASAFAQEGESSPADSAVGWVFRWLNFGIVFAAILYFFAKTASPYFRAHAQEIADRIAEGARAREAAEKQRRESQAKLAGIEKEVASLRSEAARGTEAEAQRLRALARQEAEAIDRAAQAEIAAARHAAWLQLKAFAADRAVQGAQNVLQRKISPEARKKLFGAFIEQIGAAVPSWLGRQADEYVSGGEIAGSLQ